MRTWKRKKNCFPSTCVDCDLLLPSRPFEFPASKLNRREKRERERERENTYLDTPPPFRRAHSASESIEQKSWLYAIALDRGEASAIGTRSCSPIMRRSKYLGKLIEGGGFSARDTFAMAAERNNARYRFDIFT